MHRRVSFRRALMYAVLAGLAWGTGGPTGVAAVIALDAGPIFITLATRERLTAPVLLALRRPPQHHRRLATDRLLRPHPHSCRDTVFYASLNTLKASTAATIALLEPLVAALLLLAIAAQSRHH